MLIFYHYDAQTRMYTGSSSAPDEAPVPDSTVLFSPPVIKGPASAVLNESLTEWGTIEDYRYCQVVDRDNNPATITEPGPLPEGWKYVPPVEPGSTPEEIIAATIAEYERKVQERLDAFARTKTYENMLSACTYATSTVPMFHVEGQYCIQARDATWIAAQTFLNEALAAVMAGQRGIPTWEEVEAALPPLAWPEGSRP